MASKPQPAHDQVLQFFDGLVRCETRIYNALSDQLRERHGIVTSQFEFLRHLRDNPGSRVADLAANFAIGIGATSKGIDRLEHQAWVRRLPNPADRRSSLLELTEAGVRLVTEAERTFAERTGELVTAALTPKQLADVTEALSVLRSALERDQVGMPAG